MTFADIDKVLFEQRISEMEYLRQLDEVTQMSETNLLPNTEPGSCFVDENSYVLSIKPRNDDDYSYQVLFMPHEGLLRMARMNDEYELGFMPTNTYNPQLLYTILWQLSRSEMLLNQGFIEVVRKVWASGQYKKVDEMDSFELDIAQ